MSDLSDAMNTKGFAMTRLFRWIVDHPKSTLLLVLLTTVLLASQMRHMRMETNIEEMLPKTMDAYINKQVLEERFGAADMVVIGILNDAPRGSTTPIPWG